MGNRHSGMWMANIMQQSLIVIQRPKQMGHAAVQIGIHSCQRRNGPRRGKAPAICLQEHQRARKAGNKQQNHATVDLQPAWDNQWKPACRNSIEAWLCNRTTVPTFSGTLSTDCEAVQQGMLNEVNHFSKTASRARNKPIDVSH